MTSQRYRFVVAEELGPRYQDAFEDMTVDAHDGITEISGPIRDAAHLQGVLERIVGFGLTLESVTSDAAPGAG